MLHHFCDIYNIIIALHIPCVYLFKLDIATTNDQTEEEEVA